MPRRSTKPTLPTRFEAFLAGTWQAFGGEGAAIEMGEDKVTITRMVKAEGQKPFKLVTIFRLDQLPAYSFG